MQTENTSKVIDFNAFRHQKAVTEQAPDVQFTPTLVWYPVWVMVPTPPTPVA